MTVKAWTEPETGAVVLVGESGSEYVTVLCEAGIFHLTLDEALAQENEQARVARNYYRTLDLADQTD